MVSNPPEKRIKFSEIMPINWAAFGLSKLIPTIQSDPANIPIARKNSKTGTPNLADVLPANSEIKSSIEPTNNMFSVVRFIRSICLKSSFQPKIIRIPFIAGIKDEARKLHNIHFPPQLRKDDLFITSRDNEVTENKFV